jgi:hypothetical protein
MASDRRRAGRFETLGAWLRVWTPPRDVEVPPVPWRKLLLYGVPVLALVAAGTWLAFREGDEANRERAAEEALRDERRAAAERERLREDQALHTAQVAPATRPRLVMRLEAAILADATARARSGDLEQGVRRVECEPYPRTASRRARERDPAVRSGRYHCLAVSRDIVGTDEGLLGYPFFARIHYREGRLAWCKINPIPGEQAVPDPRKVAALPAGCT